MYKFSLRGDIPLIDFEELLKLFFPPGGFILVRDNGEGNVDRLFVYNGDKNALKREMYDHCARLTGRRPPWGILTGIRPLKLTGELLTSLGSTEKVREHLAREYLVPAEKAEEALNIVDIQRKSAGLPPEGSVAIYIGIPFCPSRCAYCSFSSGLSDPQWMGIYLEALLREIDFVANEMYRVGWTAETVYIGGGTPTVYPADDLRRLLKKVQESFGGGNLREFTLEGGRPDTLDADKCLLASEYGVSRLSINPQTMKQETLDRIGRKHSVEEVFQAVEWARSAGVPVLNMDLIAGLPGETPSDFEESLRAVLGLAPENITVHCLAVKRASRIREEARDIHFLQAEAATEMLDAGRKLLIENGYRPYYLYRQKQMAGSQENTGYCIPGTEGVYNIRIMEENQTILALGAGGISKAYFPEQNRLERVANVSDFRLYVQRFDEMLLRKEEQIFRRYPSC